MGMAQPGRADLNLYAYVRNNPISRFEPSGTQDEEPVQISLDPVVLGPR